VLKNLSGFVIVKYCNKRLTKFCSGVFTAIRIEPYNHFSLVVYLSTIYDIYLSCCIFCRR